MATTVQNGGAPAGTEPTAAAPVAAVAAVEHGTEAELEQFLLGESDPVDPIDAVDTAADPAKPDAPVEPVEEEVDPVDPDPADDAENPEDHKHEDKDLPKGVQKRIDKLTALRREAEEARDAAKAQAEATAQEVAQMRAQLEAATAEAGVRQGVSRLAAMQSEQALEQHAGQLMRLKGLLMQHADGYESEDGKISLTGEDVKQKLLAIDQELMVDYPKAVRLMAQRQQINAGARQVYPELFSTDGGNAGVMQSALMAIPGLAAMPNAAYIVGDMLAGEALRAAGLRVTADGKVVRTGAKAASADKPKLTVLKPEAPKVMPKVAPPATGGAPAAAARGSAGGDRWNRVAEEGTEEALAAALEG